jgi:hypothetical protein
MNNSKNKTEQIKIEEGSVYKIDGKLFTIEEVVHQKIHCFRLDENQNPYGRMVTLGGIKNRKIEKI